MGIRFRKSIKLAPGIRMNLSGSGASWTVGPRGASVNIGQKGTYVNAGIPGTGLSSRQRLGNGKIPQPAKKTEVSITVSVSDDGEIAYIGPDGQPLPAEFIRAAKQQQGGNIRNLIQRKCHEINAQQKALEEIHHFTPNPDDQPRHIAESFNIALPVKLPEKKPRLIGLLLASHKEKIRNENIANELAYQKEMSRWEAQKQQFLTEQALRKQLIEVDIYNDIASMDTFLSEQLATISWPRETLLHFSVSSCGTKINVDVDLPEIEDLPTQTAHAHQRDYKLTLKKLSATQLQQLYMRHIHGIGFRLIGEIFSILPTIELVSLSGFSQRPNTATGHTIDEYLYSVRVNRESWRSLNFKQLQSIDVVEAFAQFELRHSMTKTGKFKAIIPFDSDVE